MKLEIRLFAGLKCKNKELASFGEDEFMLDVPDEISVGELHKILNLDSSEIAINIINGIARPKDWMLKDNDRVGIFPPVGGG